ncbi:MAG: hypothetical protein KJN67_00810 [Pontiella sp.]|nr:hypothetical protein [Pontiella sp.]NNJ69821.1 hypothetical protein [Kiritimatiellales bacterium]
MVFRDAIESVVLLISPFAPHFTESEKVQQRLEGKTIRKVIAVPGRLVNIAVS